MKFSSLLARRASLLSIIAFLLASRDASALVTGQAINNGNGTTTYSYSVANTSGAPIDFWALGFAFASPNWNPDDIGSGGNVTVPPGWFAQGGTLGLLFAQLFEGDQQSAVKNNETLSGFSFTTSLPPGQVVYSESSNGREVGSGTVVGPVAAVNRVPDSGGPLLLIPLAGLALAWRRFPRIQLAA